MTWLLKLYPPGWRRRYGAELAQMVASMPWSIGGALDLLAGAFDAWLHPELIASPTNRTGDTSMIDRFMRFECVGYGPNATRGDKAKSVTVNVAGTLVLSVVWLALVWFSKHHALGGPDQVYLLAAAPMAYLIPYLFALRYTSLKGRSGMGQAAVILSVSSTALAILMAAGWISTKL